MASALGAVAAYKVNRAQALKIRAELLEKFERALEEHQRHAASELFRLLHGLRMEFDDIVAVCSHNKSSKIILALQKTPGMVNFENGQFKYTNLFKKSWVRMTIKWVGRTMAYIVGVITAGLIVLMALLDGAKSLALLVFVIPAAAILTMQLRDLSHDRMIESLVDESIE